MKQLDEQPAKLRVKEAQLNLGNPEALGGKSKQLQKLSRDKEELPPPPDPRAHRAERRQV